MTVSVGKNFVFSVVIFALIVPDKLSSFSESIVSVQANKTQRVIKKDNSFFISPPTS